MEDAEYFPLPTAKELKEAIFSMKNKVAPRFVDRGIQTGVSPSGGHIALRILCLSERRHF